MSRCSAISSSFAASGVAVVLSTAATAVFALPARADTCFDDWSVAAPLARKEGLVTIEKVAELALAKGHGRLVRTQLCKDGEVYVYKLVVQPKAGGVKAITVDARRPFER